MGMCSLNRGSPQKKNGFSLRLSVEDVSAVYCLQEPRHPLPQELCQLHAFLILLHVTDVPAYADGAADNDDVHAQKEMAHGVEGVHGTRPPRRGQQAAHLVSEHPAVGSGNKPYPVD